MTTIYDIAKKTGLAPSTVSKVLNNYRGVSERTRKKVCNAVEELKYIPNMSARALMTKRSYMIGVLFKEDQNIGMIHPHFNEILENFRVQMEVYGFDIIFLNNKIGDRHITYLEHCMYRGIDGLLIAVGAVSDPESELQIKELMNSSLPKVSIEGIYDDTPSILSDNVGAAKDILNYLYFLGHREIGLIKCSGDSVASIQREQGYKQFLEENELLYNPTHVIEVPHYTYESGVIAAEKLIQNSIRNLPTAFFCIYDEIAMGFVDTLKKYQFQLPKDLSVVGFDDIAVARLTGLTTMRQNRKEIGVQAAKKLYQIIEENDTDDQNILIPTELVIRESCQRITNTFEV